MRTLRLTAAILAGTLMILGTGCSYLQARDHLNKGVAAMKGAKYKDATEHFKEAMVLDPKWEVPQLYLATAYMSQWIPGADSPENKEFAQQAKEGFQKVLAVNPNDTTALASLASMAFSEATTEQLTPEQKNAKLDESAEWHKKHIAVMPTAEHHYTLAVIGYTKWVPAWLEARRAVNLKQEDAGPIPDPKIRADLQTKFGAILDDGIVHLQESLKLDPEYENSMVYMNLLVREKADLFAEKAQYETAVKEADDWMAKYLATKKAKAEKASKAAASGIVQDSK
jgi:tetratricopeptide (TPR) repeat protein